MPGGVFVHTHGGASSIVRACDFNRLAAHHKGRSRYTSGYVPPRRREALISRHCCRSEFHCDWTPLGRSRRRTSTAVAPTTHRAHNRITRSYKGASLPTGCVSSIGMLWYAITANQIAGSVEKATNVSSQVHGLRCTCPGCRVVPPSALEVPIQ